MIVITMMLTLGRILMFLMLWHHADGLSTERHNYSDYFRSIPKFILESPGCCTNLSMHVICSLPADVLWGSFVTHSFLPHGGTNECVTNKPQRTSAGSLCYLGTGLIFNFVVVGWGEEIDVGGGYRKRDRLQNFFQ